MEIEPGRWDYGELTKDEIAELDTTFAARAFALYNEWKTFNVLPHGRGTMDERRTVLTALFIIEEEAHAWDRWEMEKTKKEA